MKFEKLKDKNNLPIILFFIILINYIPLILPNMISKESHGVGTIPMVICFGIECLLLAIFLYKKVEINKDIKKHVIILSIISLILFIIQIKNVILNDYKIMDFANIICQFINVLFLFICLINLKVDDEKIILFMKAIMYMAVLACINNMILYFGEILQMFGLRKGGYPADMKSFFANRNQFAFFLYVAIIAGIYTILKEDKIVYKVMLGLFVINLFFTMSRTGILVAGIFVFVYLLTFEKISKKNKTKILTIVGISGIIGLIIINIINPNLINRFVRFDRIKDLSGRTDIWSRGINVIFENPINFLFGVGRFKGTDVLQYEKKSFSQFHNIYIDSLVTGGVMELILVVYIYGFVIKRIFKSNMDKKYKNLYLSMFVTYAIYICLESFGRFSIGCSDTLCLIFFVSIPLLHANSCSM
ncbi:MAG: O-antigen ligase family protein [Clostridia bacterium]|nr:O-antigen ligase family protein [Clostridia bacterium]